MVWTSIFEHENQFQGWPGEAWCVLEPVFVIMMVLCIPLNRSAWTRQKQTSHKAPGSWMKGAAQWCFPWLYFEGKMLKYEGTWWKEKLKGQWKLKGSGQSAHWPHAGDRWITEKLSCRLAAQSEDAAAWTARLIVSAPFTGLQVHSNMQKVSLVLISWIRRVQSVFGEAAGQRPGGPEARRRTLWSTDRQEDVQREDRTLYVQKAEQVMGPVGSSQIVEICLVLLLSAVRTHVPVCRAYPALHYKLIDI